MGDIAPDACTTTTIEAPAPAASIGSTLRIFALVRVPLSYTRKKSGPIAGIGPPVAETISR